VLRNWKWDFSATPPAETEQRFVAAMRLLDRAVVTLSAFAGLLTENITRGYGWRFLQIGRRLERSLQMTALLRVGITQAPFDLEPYLQMLLEIADSAITYRTRYFTTMRTEFVLELLLADDRILVRWRSNCETARSHGRSARGGDSSGRAVELSVAETARGHSRSRYGRSGDAALRKGT